MASVQSAAAAVVRRRIKRQPHYWSTGIGLAVLVLAGWLAWVKTHPVEDPMAKMLTATVTRGDLTETITATGSIEAQTGAQVKIGSQITGVIKRLYADIGTRVQAGQLIAELDLPDVKDQYDAALDAYQAAVTKAAQTKSQLPMTKAQDSAAVDQARANLRNSEAQLHAAEAGYKQQVVQTPSDIRKAETTLSANKAALSTARSNYAQAQADANLEISTAEEQLRQGQANAINSRLTNDRNKNLLKKGFVAQSVVDASQAADDVNQSIVTAAQQNLGLVKEKARADLQTAHDQVTQAEENVTAAVAALDAARAEVELTNQKQAAVVAARASVVQMRAALNSAIAGLIQDTIQEQNVLQAEDAMRQARATADYNQAQVAKTYIRSPIKGTVIQLAAQQGETLAAGLSAPTLIVVADLTRLEADAYVDEADVAKVKIGQVGDVTVDAYPKHTFKCRVAKIDAGSTIQQNVVTYDVHLFFEKIEPRFNLRPDMTANLTLQTGTRHGVVLVPSEAVKVGVRGTTVNVLTKKDGKPVVTPTRIRTGASDGVNTEIREGVSEGQTIVLASMDNDHRGPQSPFGPNKPSGQSGSGGRRGGN